jgi:DNA-binding NtrC family response regulator
MLEGLCGGQVFVDHVRQEVMRRLDDPLRARTVKTLPLGLLVGEALRPDEFYGVPTPSGVANQDAAAATLQELERHAIADALAKAKGNKTAAAAALGITRMRLYTKLRRFGLPSQ